VEPAFVGLAEVPMMRTGVHVAGLMVLCAGSFMFGMSSDRFRPSTEVQMSRPGESSAWTDVVAAARQTADAGSLRAMALETLDAAQTRSARVQALDLLGWVAQPGDESLLMAYADAEPSAESRAATNALGHLGTPEAVDGLVYLATGQDPRGRATAISSLGFTGQPAATDFLVRALNRPSDASAAAQGLAAAGTDQAATALALAFRSSSTAASPGIAEALGQFPAQIEQASEALYEGVRSGDRVQREAAFVALARAGDPGVLPMLEEQSRAGSVGLRLGAIAGLGALHHPGAVRVLRDLVVEGPPQIAEAAGRALAGSPVPSASVVLLDLTTEPGGLGERAVRWIPNPAEPEALVMLADLALRGPRGVAPEAAKRLVNHPWKAKPPSDVLEVARVVLAGRLRDAPHGAAASLLVVHGSRRDRGYVADQIGVLSMTARASLVRELATSEGPGAEEVLRAMLDDPALGVQALAADALIGRSLGLDASVGRALAGRVTEDGSGYVIRVLSRIGTPEALDAVEDRALRGTRRESMAAVYALAQAHPTRLRELMDALPDERRPLGYRALLSSSSVSPAVVEAALASGVPEVRLEAIGRLADSDPPGALDRLTELASDDDQGVRSNALVALGELGDPRALDAILAVHGPEPWSTAAALTSLGTAEANRTLTEMALSGSSSPMREAAIHQLGWHEVEGALETVGVCLGDDDPAVARAAIAALEGMGTTASARVLADWMELAQPLRSEEWELVSRAAQALDRLGGEVAADHADTMGVYTDPLNASVHERWGFDHLD